MWSLFCVFLGEAKDTAECILLVAVRQICCRTPTAHPISTLSYHATRHPVAFFGFAGSAWRVLYLQRNRRNPEDSAPSLTSDQCVSRSIFAAVATQFKSCYLSSNSKKKQGQPEREYKFDQNPQGRTVGRRIEQSHALHEAVGGYSLVPHIWNLNFC